MKNNIFDFATSELSQDAFICWCVNWFNDDSRPALKEMAIRFLQKLSGADKIVQLSRPGAFDRNVAIGEETISVKIDVLLVVNGTIAVIIEDKTYTGEHDDQISRYVRGLKHLAEHAAENDAFYGIKEIRTVYLKTGFLYDDDKSIKADVILSGDQFLEYLLPYEGNSEILDSYIARTKNLLEWYDVYGRYDKTDEASFWDWNISRHQIAQYRLMRDIFPETLWADRGSRAYRVYHGTSFGRPWTQTRIFHEKVYKGTEDRYCAFWRIDTDGEGPYISLRFYEWFDKNDTVKKERHRNQYEAMSKTLKELVDGNPDKFFFTWKEAYPGYRGNYKESALIHLELKDKLKNWPAEKDVVIRSVRELTRMFVEGEKLWEA